MKVDYYEEMRKANLIFYLFGVLAIVAVIVIVDLSAGAFKKIASLKKGVINVKIERVK